MKVDVTYDSDMQSDFDDIRFRLAANQAQVESLKVQAQVQLARLGGRSIGIFANQPLSPNAGAIDSLAADKAAREIVDVLRKRMDANIEAVENLIACGAMLPMPARHAPRNNPTSASRKR